MCGRYTLKSSGEELARHFALGEVPVLAHRYNIAPSQEVLVVRADARGTRSTALLRWGLVPAWAKDATVGSRMINARSETAATKPAFREALRARRCIVPMDGFYEWKREKRDAGAAGRRMPHWFTSLDESLFGVAGLWEQWWNPSDPDGSVLQSCALLTTAANACVAQIHDRMPVILEPSAYRTWLDPGCDDPALLSALLAPSEAARMKSRPVNERANDPRFDEPACLAPPDPPAQGDLFG